MVGSGPQVEVIHTDGPPMENVVDIVSPDTKTTATRAPGLYNGLISYDDVAVIINMQSAISQDIGLFFKQERSIPDENIIYVNVTPAETISRTIFNTMRTQIEENITSRGLKDQLNYLVTTKGVPLRVQSPNSAVDSELTMILHNMAGQIGTSGWTNSPYAGDNRPFNATEYNMYLVTRLTGYTLEEAKNLVNLSSQSYRSTGLFAFDAGGPYPEGDNWLIQANQTMANKGYTTSLDTSSVFQMNYKDVIGYASWGSNGQGYGSNFVSNGGFETDSSPADGIPDGWTIEYDVGTVAQSTDTAYQGSDSVKIDRPSVTTGTSIIGTNITLTPGARYYAAGYANLSAVAGGKGAHLFIRAYDSGDNLLAQYNGSSRTGTRLWYSMGNAHYEPPPGVAYVMVGAALSEASGIAYFDSIQLRVIKPNNTWMPGAIAETFVSTGGRSMTYGTQYGQSLIADTVREGVSGISGHVYEPYLSACGRPYIMFDSYTNGYNMAESFYMALPWIGWMEVVVGDPKMCPFFDNRADLEIDNAWVDNDTIIAGDLLSFHSSVERTGYMWNQEFNTTLYLNNLTSGTFEVLNSTLLMKDDSQIWVNMSYDTKDWVGDYTITLSLDTLYQVREKDEGNNTFTIPFTVITPPSKVSVTFGNDSVLRGGLVDVNLVVSDLSTPYDQLGIVCSYKCLNTDWVEMNMTSMMTQGLWWGQFQPHYSLPLGLYSFRFNVTNDLGLTAEWMEISAVEVMNNFPWVGGMSLEATVCERNSTARVWVYPMDLEDASSVMSVKIWYSFDNASWSSVSSVTTSGMGFYGDISFNKNTGLGDVYIKTITSDSDGNESVAYYAAGWLQVVNTQPTIGSFQVTPAVVTRGEQVTLKMNATDYETADGDLSITVEYRSDTGEWTPGQQGVTLSETTGEFIGKMTIDKTFPLGLASFRVQVKDDEEGLSPWSCCNDSVLVKNSLPTLGRLTVDKTRVYRGSSFNISIECFDYEDGTDELTVSLQYKIDKTGGNWIDISSLEKADDDLQATQYYVPLSVDVGNMSFRAQVNDLDNAGVQNADWTNFDPKVEVQNNPPAITDVYVPGTSNGTVFVDYLVTALATDLEDRGELDVIVHWTLVGQGLEGDVALTYNDASGEFQGNVRFDVPRQAGTYKVDYRITATDADGAQAVATMDGATEVTQTTGTGPKTDDDDVSGFGGMGIWIIIIIVIIIIFLVLAVIIFIVYRKRSWPNREQPPSMPPQEERPLHPAPQMETASAAPRKPLPPAALPASKEEESRASAIPHSSELKSSEEPKKLKKAPIKALPPVVEEKKVSEVSWEDDLEEDEELAMEEAVSEESTSGEEERVGDIEDPTGEDQQLEELETLEEAPELEAIPEDDDLEELDDLLEFDDV